MHARIYVWFSIALACTLSLANLTHADDEVFSGPQIGERLSDLKLVGAFDAKQGESFDFPATENGDAVTVVFFHKRTRPAFGLTNAVTRFATSRESMRTIVVFLTDDVTETTQWLGRVRRNLPPKVTFAVSPDGQAGPGAYGLNRNVELTVLVAHDGVVKANFALVQPSAQTDGPKILRAIADASGGGDVPDIVSLMGRGRMQAGGRNNANRDPKLGEMLRSLININSDARVIEVAGEIEAYVKQHEAARKQLGEIAQRIVNSGRLENYGTDAVQAQIEVWAKKFGPAAQKKQQGDSAQP